MCRRMIYVVVVMMLGLAPLNLVYGFNPGDPDLLAWWTCDEGAGIVAGDVSGNGNDGTFVNGAPSWVEGIHGNAVQLVGPTLIEVPPLDVELTEATMAGWIKPNGAQPDWSAIIMTRDPGLATGFNVLGFQLAYHWNDTSDSWSYRGGDLIAEDDWTFAAVTIEPDKATFYVNGVAGSVNAISHGPCTWNSNIYLGGDGTEGWVSRRMNGALDDVSFFSRALTADEILAAMEGVEQVDMEIGFATQTPVIDGEVDEIWADASTQYFVPLDDPANASGIWKVLYDSENLYVLVDMTDDSLQNDSASSWQDDSVEVYFDGGNTKLNTPLSGDDHQYTFGWTTDDIQGTNIDGATEGIEHAQVDTDTGWCIEIKMPWLSIQGIEPQARDLIGIDCYYNDDDDGGDSRENKLLSFSAIEGWNDASQWGTAMLIAEPEPEPVDPGTNGLVAYYTFENDANDSSGNDLHGTLVGDAKFAEGPAGYGMALELDGDGDYVDCGTPPALVITEAISIACWVNPVQLGGEQGFAGLDAGYSFKAHGEGVRFTTPGILDHSSANLILEAGVWQHVAATFQSGQDEGLVFYLNGVETERMTSSAINVGSGPFRIGNNQWDEHLTGLIDEVVIYNRVLSAGEISYLEGERATPVDVTAPGDIVKGVPDDGNWPGAETPDLAIDDNTATKYLHFAGDFDPDPGTGGTGIQVTPSAGPSIVTGLTLTTANDVPGRDPISFELSGSNEGIDGPYELIAVGDIIDFAQADEWPRFTMNTTPISFDNDVAYKNYQLIFTAIRGPVGGSVNSMQIAEVELLGVIKRTGVNIILVSGNHDFDVDGVVDDFMLADILKGEGHTVDYQPGNWTELDDGKIAALNAADLVIISRCTSSGDYNEGDEPTQWNSITTPMINFSTHLTRSSRWLWLDSTSLLDLAPAVMELADGTQIDAMDEAVGLSSFIDAAPGNGTVLATGDGLPWIIEWEAGVEYYDGAGQIAGGPRVFFVAGTQELEGVSNWGEWNLTPEGKTIFLNTVNMMLPQ